MFAAASHGFLMQLSLIVAIGAQNAFVLRQGLRRSHVAAVCLICTVSDALLIALGVGGFGALLAVSPRLGLALRLAGAIFLAVYGARSALAAWRGGETLNAGDSAGTTLQTAILTCLAITWLNPHVYLDSVVLLGSVAAQCPGHGTAFGCGAALASGLFFFALGYGARFLRPILANPTAWRALEGMIAVTMWSIAAGLLLG